MPICPYCRKPIEEDEVPECPDCGLAHHLHCWIDHNGCSTPSCSQAPPDGLIPAAGPAGSPRPSWANFSSAGETAHSTDAAAYAAKNRSLFMFLGLLLGPFGIHNFYAGYVLRGALQLGVTCGTLFYGGVVTWVWALIEILVVSRDALSRPME